MSLKDDISNDMKAALKARDRVRLGSIRMLQAAIQRCEVDDRVMLDDAGVIAIVEKLIKQGRDAAGQFVKGNRQDLADKELADISVWKKYLPEQLGDDEVNAMIEAAIADTGAASMKDMGKVMGQLKARLQGRADMGQVSARIKARLAG
ncbi:MAG: GatB/YqeY domain-containing protein [Gammaproteobacteria bacterium]|nr:MAG: GatB/YqeY domain-containing protein [Gammaproteobacteria bacterium]